LAIVIPKDLSSDLQAKVDQNVEKIVSSLGMTDSTATSEPQRIIKKRSKTVF
jgi:ABC-2 type transport system permease protein